MRRVSLNLLLSVALFVAGASVGCTKKIIADNARNSAASFLTGIFSSAVNASLNSD